MPTLTGLYHISVAMGSAHARCEASRVELRYEQASWGHGNGQNAELGAI